SGKEALTSCPKKTGEIWRLSQKERARVIDYVCRRLENRYGRPRHGNPEDPLDDLIFVILSNKTSPDVGARIYATLKQRFTSWEQVLRSPRVSLTNLLRPGGLSLIKSNQIRGLLTKERDVNNFPISRWLGNSAIVPFGKNFVKDDLHALLESRSILPAGFVYLVEEAYLHLQSGGRFGFGHVVLDGPQRVEDHSSTRAGQMREQAVLNRIVLRTVRRVMGHADLDAQPVRQFLEVLLE